MHLHLKLQMHEANKHATVSQTDTITYRNLNDDIKTSDRTIPESRASLVLSHLQTTAAKYNHNASCLKQQGIKQQMLNSILDSIY
jgi:hypothetical protein